jgi:serine protease AprX
MRKNSTITYHKIKEYFMDHVRESVNADFAHKRGYIGTGITVAVMDTGIVYHPDFDNRVILFKDFTSRRTIAYDDNGHGTHVCGIIGGTGFTSRGKYMGMAPGVKLIMLKVLDKLGNGNTSQVLQALQWIIENKEKYRIRIVNISVGMLNSAKQEERKQLLAAVEEVWNHQVVVIVAAGNNGPAEGSVTIPGMCKTVITVGSCDDDKRDQRHRGMVPGYSGRGPTENCIVKPELVAPGTKIQSCSTNMFYETKSGTSMATPVVTGAVALLLSRYPYLTPAQVKLRLYETATDIGKDKNIQGWGKIDVQRLL